MKNSTIFILGAISVISLTAFGALLPSNAETDDSNLLELIDFLEQENTQLVIENDKLYTKNTELTKKVITEHYKKTDARKALEYTFGFIAEDTKQVAISIATQDTATKYFEARD